MASKIKVLIIDDHPVVRQGVVAMIQAYEDSFDVVGEAEDPAEGLAKVQTLQPDVVVTDLVFNGQAQNGISIIKELNARSPAIPCVLITSNMQGHYMVDAFRAGAKAFLYKDSAAKEYVRALEAAHEGMTYFPPELASELDRWNRLPKLTPSEERVLPYVAMGLTSKQIAREYTLQDPSKGIESRTIDQHKSNIKQKFGIDSSGSLVSFAIRYCDENGVDYKGLKLQSKRLLLDF